MRFGKACIATGVVSRRIHHVLGAGCVPSWRLCKLAPSYPREPSDTSSFTALLLIALRFPRSLSCLSVIQFKPPLVHRSGGSYLVRTAKAFALGPQPGSLPSGRGAILGACLWIECQLWRCQFWCQLVLPDLALTCSGLRGERFRKSSWILALFAVERLGCAPVRVLAKWPRAHYESAALTS